MPFKKVGDWKKLERMLAPINMRQREVDRCMVMIGITVTKKIKTEIKQRKYVKNHPWTIAMKSTSAGVGDQPLVDHGQLVKSINYKVDYSGIKSIQVFIGVRKGTIGANGKDMVELARVLHEGAVIPVTSAMRMYLLSKGFALKPSTAFIVIPARPFVRQVVENPATKEEIRTIYVNTLLRILRLRGER